MPLSRRALLSLIAAAPAARAARSAKAYWVYVGAMTRRTAKGIYVTKMDAESGALTEPRLVAETSNPLFLKIHPNERVLYAGMDLPNAPTRQGAVGAYTIDAVSGDLTPLNFQPTRGVQPIYIDVDKTGRTLVVANYTSGSVAALPIGHDGALDEVTSFFQFEGSGVNLPRQAGPHTHCAQISPDNKFALVSDLGIDRMMIYRLDPALAKLEPADPPFHKFPDGSGPRHITFHPRKAIVYLLTELKSTITAMRWDSEHGRVTELQTISTLPDNYTARNAAAEIRVHPDGEFLYATNRGQDTFAQFAIHSDGTLALVERIPSEGVFPNSFALDPPGKLVVSANQTGNTVVTFSIHHGDGRLKPTGHSIALDSASAVRMIAVP